jgi:CBS-domain-containing membrane protein
MTDQTHSAKPSLLEKLKGAGAAILPRAPTKTIALAGLGGLLALSAAALLTQWSDTPLVLGSFGASCVLVFGFPDSPFSQPRNVIFGHLLSSFIGLACLALLGQHWWTAGIAAGAAIVAMMATRTVHPPAGSNPVIVFLAHPGWGFLLFPTLAGAAIVVLVALIFNNLVRPARYPTYW